MHDNDTCLPRPELPNNLPGGDDVEQDDAKQLEQIPQDTRAC
jgi:hypothetical protein